MTSTSYRIGIFSIIATLSVACSQQETHPDWGFLEQPIVYGQPDTSQEHQGVVYISMSYNERPLTACTGTLIAPDIVLTAGHCVSGIVYRMEIVEPDRLSVHFGDSSSTLWATRSASEVMRHPGYQIQVDGIPAINDIAMIRLSSAAPEEVPVIPALPRRMALSQADIGIEVELVGYGKTETGSAGVKLRAKNNLDIICEGPDACTAQAIPAAPYSMCIDVNPGGICSGDSGGPALLSIGSKEYVVGVHSYADTQCQAGGCSTKVDAFWDFISTAVREDVSQGELGDPCGQNADCTSSFCVSGVCCDSACRGECQACNLESALGTCLPAPEGALCGDRNPCNGNETCQQGTCRAGDPLVCDDGNVCTQDSCQSGVGCVYEPLVDGTQCLDDNLCNGVETCQSGSCKASGPLECDDGDDCTIDTCDAEEGCRHEIASDGTACDAGPCGPGQCAAGSCIIPNEEQVCDDGHVCTTDWCDSKTGCQHETLDCDDGNECTLDSCDASQGCRHEPVSEGTACGAGPCGAGQCAAGECMMPNQEQLCDDGQPCTKDWCDSVNGCQHEPLPDNASCGDCQMCIGGQCGPQPNCDKGGGSGCSTTSHSTQYSLIFLVALFLLGIRRRASSAL